jgi:O-antigen biosynthesis protein
MEHSQVQPDQSASPGRRLVETVVHDIRPRSVLHAGCRDGSVVAALREQGIDAYGLDVSGAATASVVDAAAAHCSFGSLLSELDRGYDLVVCIDGLQDLPPDDRAAAIANICRHTDEVLFVAPPDANPSEWWVECFAEQGFHSDVAYNASGVAEGAVRFRRSSEPLSRVVVGLERQLARERREHVDEISRLRARLDDLVAALSQTESVVVDTQRRLAEAERIAGDLWGIADSATYRAGVALRRGVQRALPPDTRRGRVAVAGVHGVVLLGEQGPRAFVQRLRERIRTRKYTQIDRGGTSTAGEDAAQAEYERWLAASAPTEQDLARMRELSHKMALQPLVSLVMPVYNSAESWLREAIASVRAQAYVGWELCIADDASPDPHVRAVLEEEAAAEPRIKLIIRDQNGGIAAATNSALEATSGKWIGFLDHDDLLQPHALYRVVERINKEPDVDLVYSDEDKLLRDGRRGIPFFKPDWSPDLLSTINYVNHFTVVRADRVHEVGGLRSGFDGSQDHDLLLRITDRPDLRVSHVADVLYTWRMVPGSAALDADAKPRAVLARRRAIADAVERRGLDGRVEPGAIPGWFDVRYTLRGTPQVSIIIPTRDRVDLLRRCIDSIRRRSTYRNLRVVVIDNDSRDPATLEYLRDPALIVVRHPGNFNYAAILNHAVADLPPERDEHLLFLNNDMEVTVPDWVEAMLEQSQRPEVGAVGCRLLYPDGRPQHEGVAIGIGGTANNVDLGSYFSLGRVVRDVGAVTGAAMMMRRSTFEEMEGFDEELRVAFNDVDLCMRLRRAGYRILYTPLAQLVHYESASRGRIHPLEDEAHFAKRWGSGEALRDPYVNPNILWYSPPRLRPRLPLTPA